MIGKGYKKMKSGVSYGMKKGKKMAHKSSMYGMKLESGLQNYFKQDREKAKSCLKGGKC